MATDKPAKKPRTSAAVKNRYNAKAYDRVNLIVPKGDKASIAEAAKTAGQSTNAYIVQAVQERMQADQARMAEDRQS